MINCDREDCTWNDQYGECMCKDIDIDEMGSCTTFSLDFDDVVAEELYQNMRDGYKRGEP